MANPAPSNFATLLRRSKFASFDPHIDRVYTTYDGHAARGNFGLKRPLALRRRNAYITVKAMDSREQQTVWESAEQKSRAVKMWDEVGVTPQIPPGSPWSVGLGARGNEVVFFADSEFTTHARSMVDVQQRRSDALPNMSAMSKKEYVRYLDKLRKLRPAFRAYLEDHVGKKTLWQHSQDPKASSNAYMDFLQTHAYQQYHSPRPLHLEQQPHRHAGLIYSNPSSVQSLFANKLHPGRIISSGHNAQTVAFAGRTSALLRGDRPGAGDEHGVTTMQYTVAKLSSPPKVVGTRLSGLKDAMFTTQVAVIARKNPYTPGSREYIAQRPSTSPLLAPSRPEFPKANFSTSFTERDRSAMMLMDTLGKFNKKLE